MVTKKRNLAEYTNKAMLFFNEEQREKIKESYKNEILLCFENDQTTKKLSEYIRFNMMFEKEI